MASTAVPAPPIRVDRAAEYKIVHGGSLKRPAGFSSLKYNQKTSGIKTNPNDPTLTRTSIGYNLKFIHPNTKNEILYEATSSTPAKKTEYFLVFDPATKIATLERLDAAFVFNAGIYAQPYPPLKPEVEDDFEFSADSDTADSEDDTGGVFDYRHFMNRNSAAEDKRQKRLGALKRAGKEIVDIPDDQLPPDGELIIPDAIQPHQDQDSEMDAPGESDDEMETYAPPPPPSRAKAAPKPRAPPKAKAPPKPRAPPKKKAVPSIPPPTTQVNEIIIPDAVPPPALDSDDEEIDFSDEDEDDPPCQPETVAAPEPVIEESVDIDVDDFTKELEEALGPAEDDIMQQGGIIYEDDDDVSDEDEDQPACAPPRPVGGAPKSLAEMYGGTHQEEEDSESEEE
ncbi:hypothetical protein BZA77DRAFT_383877 [Pyronema omphalodes]|nr:hypothetical protein BZA77DRAFT_383877 [Pyronema omphalodes]